MVKLTVCSVSCPRVSCIHPLLGLRDLLLRFALSYALGLIRLLLSCGQPQLLHLFRQLRLWPGQ